MIFLIIPVLAIALYPILRYNYQSALSMAQAVRCFGKRKLRFCREAEFSGAFGVRSSALRANSMCFFARCGAEGLDSAGNLKFLRGSQSLHRVSGSCFGRWPRFPLALCASSSLKTMQPCQLVRASREHCAFLLCAAAHGLGLRLGALPWRNRGNLHARSACLFAQCVVDFGSTYLQYAFALSPSLAQKCCAAQARRLP